MPIFHFFCCISLLLPSLASAQNVDLRYFGYAGVSCGHDDPHDAVLKDDFLDEVADFTNINQVCMDADPRITADRLKAMAAAGSTPLFSIEAVLFAQTEQGLGPNHDRAALWPLVDQAVLQSGLESGQIVFYLVDEPSRRGLSMDEVSEAAQFLQTAYPNARTMLIEAYDEKGPGQIPTELAYWGFNAYALPDPGAEPRYTAYLDQARQRMHAGQNLVLVMDATLTEAHRKSGISATDMAGVARAYLALARQRGDIAAVLGYAWIGGIDGIDELGVRNLPLSVQEAHRTIGTSIVGRRD